MKTELIESADTIGMFCRINMNTKRELPIRTSEMGVLIFIKKSDRYVTPLEISNFFGISKPSVTVMIKSLLKKRFLDKKKSKTDGRSYYINITAKGSNLVNKAFDEYMKLIQVLEEKMKEEEFREMIRLLDKANHIINSQEELE